VIRNPEPLPDLSEARALYRDRAYRELLNRVAGAPDESLLAEPAQRERALALCQRLGPICQQRGNDRLFRDRLNLEGMLRFARGEVEAASELWSELLSVSSRAGDADFVARSNQNLGVIFTLSGSLDAALVSYERALAGYREMGQWRGMAQALQNVAIAHREMDRWHEADRCCQDAIRYAQEDGSEDEVARAQQERALVLCLSGDPLLAEATASQALRRWVRLEQPDGLGGTLQVLGVIALEEGRDGEARTHLSRALELARETRDAFLEAETLETLAALAVAEGLPDESARCQTEAEQLFASLRAESWCERLRVRLRTLLARRGIEPGPTRAPPA
jgi:tetratricopeptide (TPR) repeat protein